MTLFRAKKKKVYCLEDICERLIYFIIDLPLFLSRCVNVCIPMFMNVFERIALQLLPV